MGINNLSAQPQNVGVNNLNVVNNPKRYFIDPRRTDKNLQADTVQLSTNNDKLKKIGIGAAIAVGVAGIGTAVYFLTRGKVKLPEHLDFIPAQTKEEAIKYAKTQLGIKSYDSSMPLDVMNWVNEGITNVHNVRKGKVHLFDTVNYASDRSVKEMRAAFSRIDNKPGSKFGNILTLNKNYFENIDDEVETGINCLIKNNIFYKNKEGKLVLNSMFDGDDLLKKANKFIENPKSLTFNDKLELYERGGTALDCLNTFERSSLSRINQMLENESIQEVLLANSSLPDLKQIEKLSTKQQRNILIKIMNTCKNSGIHMQFEFPSVDSFYSLYHEIGHLEHCHNLGGMNNLLSIGKPKECLESIGKISDVTNNFINSKEKQQIANSISGYARTSPAEFVAEVYKKLINRALGANENISDSALKLYQEYGGVMID